MYLSDREWRAREWFKCFDRLSVLESNLELLDHIADLYQSYPPGRVDWHRSLEQVDNDREDIITEVEQTRAALGYEGGRGGQGGRRVGDRWQR